MVATRTSTGRNIRFCPRIQLQPVKANATITDRNFCEVGAHLGIKAIAVHTQIGRGIAVADDAREDLHGHSK